MIDFDKSAVFKLSQDKGGSGRKLVQPILLDDEEVYYTFSTIRDTVAFTSKRIIAVNVQGLTGKKKDFTSLHYSKIQAYSVESAGVLDWDGELELWFSGLGSVKFEFTSNTDLSGIAKLITSKVP